jgi:hypothetical protein
MKWEDEYRHSPLFDNLRTARKLLSFTLDDSHFTAKPASPPSDTEPYLADLYRYPVLTRDGEKMLFLKMNCAKFRAAQLGKPKSQIQGESGN